MKLLTNYDLVLTALTYYKHTHSQTLTHTLGEHIYTVILICLLYS